ncbi:MAG: mycothiol transferase [Acidimicrobiales bacterium]
MNGPAVLLEGLSRIGEMLHGAVEGLSDEQLLHGPDDRSNPIVWLAWHLTRIQDDHVAGVAGTEQVWISEGWAERFDLPLPVSDHGYGHTPEEVASVRAGAESLLGYYDAVEKATVAYMKGLTDDDLDRVVDTRWNPPVTLGVRLVSVLNDDTAHAAQAAYLRGLIDRR